MEERYLIMVNPNFNNNKFYKMTDNGDGTWTATYGRIGEDNGFYGTRTKVYPSHLWFRKLVEKLAKGYVDETELHTNTKNNASVSNEFLPIPDETIRAFVDWLVGCSRECIRRNYTVEIVEVSHEMIDSGRQMLSQLSRCDSVEQFNAQLIELFHVIPRKMKKVCEYTANEPEDFGKILQREEELLDVLESQVKHFTVHNQKVSDKTILEELGIEMFIATKEQTAEVMKHLNDSLKPHVKRIYRVINKRTQEALNEYLETHDAEIKMLWHGSRNENWMSIMEKGLLLSPNAIITGKMFGKGIYFAPSSCKSWGYTSSPNAVWTSERGNTAIMGLYATAYGTPYDVYKHSSDMHFTSESFQRLHPEANCLHAHKDKGMLLNDEIVFYREDQMTLNYIVEFNA